VIPYLRVLVTSNLDTQVAKVKTLGIVDRVFKEKASGIKNDRPVLAECPPYLREGDTLVVTRTDRIARRSSNHCAGSHEERRCVPLPGSAGTQ
jgi:DNA invertase Pin-like site-specific DNA recombinase